MNKNRTVAGLDVHKIAYISVFPDDCQEKEQDENPSGNRQKDTCSVWHMITKEEDFIDVYLKRLEELTMPIGQPSRHTLRHQYAQLFFRPTFNITPFLY